MDVCKETKWLCENSKSLEKFAGQWVAFSSSKGIVSRGSSFDMVLKSVRPRSRMPAPFVFHVPSPHELLAPIVPVGKKK